MRVSVKLAISYLKSNKKKTLITAICILISTVLITTILLLIDSYKEYMINSERNKANWEVAYSGITYEEACTIEKHSNVIAVISGHYHQNREEFYDNIYHIITKNFSNNGYYKIIEIDDGFVYTYLIDNKDAEYD